MTAQSLATLCGLLGSETRLALLKALHEGPKSVTSLSEVLGLTLPAVSNQLQKLFARDLVTKTRDAQTITYALAEPIDPILLHVLDRMES